MINKVTKYRNQETKLTIVTLDALQRASNKSREEALTPAPTTDKEDRPILAITYHPHNLRIKEVLLRNFNILQEDPELKKIFPKPPLVAYKRDQNLSDVLVRATFRESSTPPKQPGNQPCHRPKCLTCPYIDPSLTLNGPLSHFDIKSNFTCTSTNIVYIISCTRCNKLYVGETYRALQERFSEHLRAIRLDYNTPVAKHFNDGNHTYSSNLKVAAVWNTGKDGTFRKHMESLLISRLGTHQPQGLNLRP